MPGGFDERAIDAMLGSTRSGQQGQRARGAGSEAQQPGTSRAPHHSPGGGATNYRVVYSSDDSLSDGELHVERRQGSISAWYQRGSAPTSEAAASSSPRHQPARQRRSPRRSTSASSRDSGSEGAAPLRSSVTVVLHDHAGGSQDREEEEGPESRGSGGCAPGGDSEGGGGPASLAVGQQELQGMINWETNNLFDYLRGLCQQGDQAGTSREAHLGQGQDRCLFLSFSTPARGVLLFGCQPPT